MIDTLIPEISDWLSIEKGTLESKADWQKRVLYSSVAMQMLASVYDTADDIEALYDGTVSMQHMSNRGIELVTIYNDILDVEVDSAVDRLRELFVETGCILHRANRLYAVQPASAPDEAMFFTRGVYPWQARQASGAGILVKESTGMETDLDALFGIEPHSIADWNAHFMHTLKWRTEPLPSEVEFLNLDRYREQGYWARQNPTIASNLCRSLNPSQRNYRLIRTEPEPAVADIPEWMTENADYRRIALGLISNHGTSPSVLFRTEGLVCYVSSGYLLPSAEQNFYELFSWPEWARGKASPFNRIIPVTMMPTLRRVFSRLGFIIKEI